MASNRTASVKIDMIEVSGVDLTRDLFLARDGCDG